MDAKFRLPHTLGCRTRFEEALKDDKKVKLSAKRANEFAAKIIGADVTRTESAKKAKVEKAEAAIKDPADGPNKKPRITSATGASSSTTQSTHEVSVERKSRFAVLPVDTELEEINRELAKRSNDESRNSGGSEEKDETSEREKKRRMIGC